MRPSAHSDSIDAPPIVHEVLKRPGQPLDPTTRAFVEPRFGADFSGVRVHVGAHAAEAASAIAARAFTTGRDIVFGAGEYAPHAASGLKLLAHELAHVSQQEAGCGQATIRRFESVEHKKIGDEATKHKDGTDMMVVLSPYFKCTFGDMTALAGDFFGSLEEMKALAAVDGETPETVAELKYARDVGVRKQKDTYDSAVKEAVGKRASKLVLGNADHFSNPKLEDRKKTSRAEGDAGRGRPLQEARRRLTDASTTKRSWRRFMEAVSKTKRRRPIGTSPSSTNLLPVISYPTAFRRVM